MIGSEIWPNALFGGKLHGTSALRYVFVDEAGTSAKERVTVVVAVIVRAEIEMLLAETRLKELKLSVPPDFRENYVFHATDVFNLEKYRSRWDITDRLAFMKRVMYLPRQLGIPFSVALIHRDDPAFQSSQIRGMTKEQWHHYLALHACLTRADKYIRDYGHPSEVATVVAEDAPGMKKYLRTAPKEWKKVPFVLPPNSSVRTAEEVKKGYGTQESEMILTRIRDSIHFVDKGDEALTEIADALAFGFRRYFEIKDDHGASFCEAILGGQLNRAECGSGWRSTFFWHQKLFE